ncbi:MULTISPECIES: phage tail protein [unclassified Microcoleus]|uniref:phage tail protein n=1 Tax=unclassified Microcoleus TaxID=2642155 RepID=UPI002FD24594
MPTNSSDNKKSSYLEYLPATVEADPIINGFLLAFESILDKFDAEDKNNSVNQPFGFGEYLDHIHTYFLPCDSQGKRDEQAPTEFLPWLASWVALSLRDDWEVEFKRKFISKIVPLYSKRGTKAALEEILNIYTGEKVSIYEFEEPPGYFQVEMTLSEVDSENLRRKENIAIAILNLEKPAHTVFALKILFPTMRIINDYKMDKDKPIGICVGKNTLLGTTTNR